MAKFGPDFFVIGMQKAATRWVYDSAHGHPGFKMPIIKEIHHYDSRRYPVRDNRKDRIAWTRSKIANCGSPNRRKRWETFLHYLEKGRQLDDYMGLFRRSRHMLSGDVTPAYSALERDQIETIAANHPHSKAVLMIREPVARLWSAFNMYARQELKAAGQDPGAEGFREQMQNAMTPAALETYLEKPGVQARSFASRVYDNWLAVFGSDRLHLVFFDDLVASPRGTWFELERFVSGGVADTEFVPAGNRKQEHAKITIDTGAISRLQDFFRQEYRDCIDRFGDKAEGWSAAYRA